MENKLNFSDRTGLAYWLSNTFKEMPLTSNVTYSPSLMHYTPDLTSYLIDSAKATTDQERDAIYSKALSDATKFSAPIEACAWATCEGMVRKGLAWFDKQDDNQQFQLWNRDYHMLKQKPPSMDQLLAYQMCALKWREETGFGILKETEVLKDSVVAEFRVPGVAVLPIQEMVQDMIRRRGGQAERRPVSQEHIRCCERIAKGNFSALLNPVWGELDKRNSSGLMLLTTGFAKLLDFYGAEVLVELKKVSEKFGKWLEDQTVLDAEVGKRTKEILDLAITECQNLGGGGQYRAQIAQIDSIFSSYYWIWRAGVDETSFGSVSSFLFDLGQIPRGGAKIAKALKKSGLYWGSHIVDLFADTSFKENRIHMHPAVLTTGRLSEMGACFGIIPVTNPEQVFEGSGFAKSILNIRTDGLNPAATIVTQLFNIQRQAKSLTDLDVISSEHLLHQLLVSKKSVFQNAFQVKGNAADVDIVGVSDQVANIQEEILSSSPLDRDEGKEMEFEARKRVVEEILTTGGQLTSGQHKALEEFKRMTNEMEIRQQVRSQMGKPPTAPKPKPPRPEPKQGTTPKRGPPKPRN
nr:MAG: nucleocapsid [Cencurut virus]